MTPSQHRLHDITDLTAYVAQRAALPTIDPDKAAPVWWDTRKKVWTFAARSGSIVDHVRLYGIAQADRPAAEAARAARLRK